MQVFNILVAIGLVAHTVLILFPYEGMHIYIANFLLVTCACGQFSAWLQILEKRVSPKYSGTVLLLSRTISCGTSAACPFIVTLRAPLPHCISLACCVMGFIASRKLPPAGYNQTAIDQEELDSDSMSEEEYDFNSPKNDLNLQFLENKSEKSSSKRFKFVPIK